MSSEFGDRVPPGCADREWNRETKPTREAAFRTVRERSGAREPGQTRHAEQPIEAARARLAAEREAGLGRQARQDRPGRRDGRTRARAARAWHTLLQEFPSALVTGKDHDAQHRDDNVASRRSMRRITVSR